MGGVAYSTLPDMMHFTCCRQNINICKLVHEAAHCHISLISQHCNFMLISFVYSRIYSILIIPVRAIST